MGSVVLRIVVVDDHPVVRDGLRALLEAQPDMCVVGEAADGAAAIDVVAAARPDLVLMDLSMPKLGGAEATARITKAHPNVKVVALSAHEDRGYVQLLLDAGAVGFVLKRAAADDLVRAIRAVATGGVYIDPAVTAQMLAGRKSTSGSFAAARGSLSDREAEVLRRAAQGQSFKEIAAALELSVRTVETYRARGMEKLELKSRADLIRYALQRGWFA